MIILMAGWEFSQLAEGVNGGGDAASQREHLSFVVQGSDGGVEAARKVTHDLRATNRRIICPGGIREASIAGIIPLYKRQT